jgi:outer membrane protein assembly factor BamD (BamD/ComL family)
MMARWWCALAMGGLLWAFQTPQPQEPPEEDEGLAAKQYTFNPLQAEKELQVGKYYFKKGSYKAAVLRFKEATLWHEKLAEAYLLLGEAQEKLKNWKAAREAYANYIRLESDERKVKEARERLARLPAQEKD